MIGERIRERRKAKGLTMKELGQKINLAESTIAGYESNYREPSASTLEKIAKVLDTSTDYLLGRTDNPMPVITKEDLLRNSIKRKAPVYVISDNKSLKEHLEKLISNIKPKNKNEIPAELVFIPVLGTIKAGYDLYADQQVIDFKPISRNDVSDGEYFYLIVKGDSMIDEGIKEGYRVLVRRQDYVENGKIGVVLLNGDEATLKRVFYQDDMVILQAANPSIPPRVLPIDEVRIQGQVTKVEFDV